MSNVLLRRSNRVFHMLVFKMLISESFFEHGHFSLSNDLKLMKRHEL